MAEAHTQCLLHPLAVLNISDHYSRAVGAAPEEQKAATCVVGGLIGTQKQGVTEVFNSFELYIQGSGIVDEAYFLRKAAHFKNVFHEYDVVGWYCAPQRDVRHQDTIVANSGNNNLVSLVLQPNSSDDIPFSAFSASGQNIALKVASTEAEQIGIDHIARTVTKGGSASMQLTAHLGGMHSAARKLSEGIEIICGYLKAVKEGAVPKDHGILREVHTLCNRLPTGDSNNKDKLLQDYNDVLLVAYLSSLTKTANESNELVEKFNTVFEKHRRHRPF